MNTSRPTFAHRAAQLRAQGQARIQQQRQRPLPAWLAARPRRRALALAVPVVIFTVGVIAALTAQTLGVVFMMLLAVLGLAGILGLRRATQMLDAAPAALLDERETAQRDRGYRDAFHLSAALVFTLLLLALLDGALAKLGAGDLFVADGWFYLTLASFFTVYTLPAAALTWRWQAPTEEQEG